MREKDYQETLDVNFWEEDWICPDAFFFFHLQILCHFKKTLLFDSRAFSFFSNWFFWWDLGNRRSNAVANSDRQKKKRVYQK